jgi:hypothetical protein
MNDLVESKQNDLIEICRRFGVRRLELFGSANTPGFDPQRSDLDFLAEFAADADFGPWLGRLVEFEEGLGELFDRPAHVVMASALKNPWFRREAQKTRVAVYDESKIPELASTHS